MKINYDKINYETRAGLTRKEAVLHYAQRLIEYLESHNKNYTKAQYEFICELKSIIDSIEE